MSGDPEPQAGTLVFDDGRYSVLLNEVGPLWQWTICEDGAAIQEGASISELAARADSERVVRVFHRMGPSIRAGRNLSREGEP